MNSPIINSRVAVTSNSFSNNSELCDLVKSLFLDVSFNKQNKLKGNELVSFLSGHNAAIVGLDLITGDVLDSLPDLKIIAKYGVGLDNIDLKALHERGVHLGWTPGVNALSVAELTLCFMIGLMRNVFRSAAHLKSMEWKKDGGRQLSGKSVGIVGCGNVGKAVVRLLKPFACKILVNDIVNYEEFYCENGVFPVSFETLVRESDIVSLHIPLDESTNNLVNRKVLKMMKKDAFLINTSRGGVVLTSELKNALKECWIAGAALDVFDSEPPEDRELLSLNNLMVSPHIGGNAEEAVTAMGKSAIDHLVQFFTQKEYASEGRPAQ